MRLKHELVHYPFLWQTTREGYIMYEKGRERGLTLGQWKVSTDALQLQTYTYANIIRVYIKPSTSTLFDILYEYEYCLLR